ncbi:apolipoprotein D-like [Tetranychus urticae]|uniref:Lipocalin/cytosolic fatty-acid binding domain-containing protein n=1 Tax=Tetranychus urticae TaxID=32264 RepID=T1K755_TETUR|nr:apolipoprotein D-like [Tetranychus urticae]
MKMIATLFFVFAVASSALGQCPISPTTPGSDIGKIAGRWYAIAAPTIDRFQETVTCVTEDFIFREDGNFDYTVLGTSLDGSKTRLHWLAERTESQNAFNLTDRSKSYQVTYNIVDTDYDNYLAIYSCFYLPGYTTIQTGMILSRTNTMNADKYAELTDLLVNEIGVASNTFGPIVQKDCKYWPVSSHDFQT